MDILQLIVNKSNVALFTLVLFFVNKTVFITFWYRYWGRLKQPYRLLSFSNYCTIFYDKNVSWNLSEINFIIVFLFFFLFLFGILH